MFLETESVWERIDRERELKKEEGDKERENEKVWERRERERE